jgi:hypothetical protein
MKYLDEEKNHLSSHQSFCDSLYFVFYLGLTSLDPPPENGIAINFGTGIIWKHSTYRTYSICSSTYSENSVMTRNIITRYRGTVVIKQVKGTTYKTSSY